MITSDFASDFCERPHVTSCYSAVLRSQTFWGGRMKKKRITCGIVSKKERKYLYARKKLIGDLPISFLSKEVHRFSPYILSHTSLIPSLRMTESIV